MDLEFKKYLKLSNLYEDTLIGLIDFSYNKNILPIKYNFLYNKNKVKQLINENKKMLISCGIEYVLKFKDEIREFSIKELSCNNNLQIFDKIKEELNNSLKDEVKIIEVIFDIINNSTNLRKQDYEVIQEFILTVVLILEKLQQLLS
jgi:hypothetical protein